MLALENKINNLQQTDYFKGLQITKTLLYDTNMKLDIVTKQFNEINNNNIILNDRNNILEKKLIDSNELIISLGRIKITF